MAMANSEDRAFIRELNELVRNGVTKYNADTRYTEDGRRNLIAATWVAARRASEDAYEKFAADARVRHRELERKLFGPGAKDHAAIMNWRDACDRTENVDGPTQAQRMFERACIGDDTMLAKALLQRAVRSGWNELLDSAGTHLPDQAGLIDEWRNTPNDAALAKLKTLAYHVRRPSELGTASDDQIAEWAAAAPPELAAEPLYRNTLGVAVFSLDGPQANGPDHAAIARQQGLKQAEAALNAFNTAANSMGTVA